MSSLKLLTKKPVYSVSISETHYRVVDSRTLRALIYKPEEEGPFPAVVCIHGGAWVSGDRYAT